MTVYQVFLLYVQEKGGSSFEINNFFAQYDQHSHSWAEEPHKESCDLPFPCSSYNKLSLSDLWLGAENMILNRLVVIVTGNVTYVPQTLQSLYMYPLPTTTILLWYLYQTNTFSIYLKLITLFITNCCWLNQDIFFTANVIFIQLCNKYFHCKLQLIAIILHLYDFLNPPTLFDMH